MSYLKVDALMCGHTHSAPACNEATYVDACVSAALTHAPARTQGEVKIAATRIVTAKGCMSHSFQTRYDTERRVLELALGKTLEVYTVARVTAMSRKMTAVNLVH